MTNRGLWAGDHDIVIRHVRMHVGVGGSGDAMDSTGAAANLMLDHCEYMFSKDENFSNFGAGTPNATDQWAINAWGLQPHSAGGLWAMKHVTSHHSLWTNNHTRNPKVISPDVFDWTNNLTFGWDIGMNLAGADAGGNHHVNIRGSSFFHGGSAKEAVFGGGGPAGTNVLAYTAFLADSAFDGSADGGFSPTRGEGELFAVGQEGNVNRASVAFSPTLDGSAIAQALGVPLQVDDRVTAFKKIVSQAGALRLDATAPALRDEVSQMAIDGAVAGKRQIISDPLQLGLTNAEATIWPGAAAADTDADGMPDFWEAALGLDPAAANNNELLSCAEIGASFFPPATPEGYTHLEEYLHFLAVPHVVLDAAAEPSTATLVDLRRYTAGFVAAPIFTLSNVRGGKVSQSGPGGAVISFSPNPGSVGRAGLEFTVTDADGSSWRQQLAVLVRAPADVP